MLSFQTRRPDQQICFTRHPPFLHYPPTINPLLDRPVSRFLVELGIAFRLRILPLLDAGT